MDNNNNKTIRTLNGIVIKKYDKTISVLVERYVKHPKYGKYYTKRKKFLVHDEDNKYNVGDKVKFVSCRPISKRKHFKVV